MKVNVQRKAKERTTVRIRKQRKLKRKQTKKDMKSESWPRANAFKMIIVTV